jgi:hypothetical protein
MRQAKSFCLVLRFSSINVIIQQLKHSCHVLEKP